VGQCKVLHKVNNFPCMVDKFPRKVNKFPQLDLIFLHKLKYFVHLYNYFGGQNNRYFGITTFLHTVQILRAQYIFLCTLTEMSGLFPRTDSHNTRRGGRGRREYCKHPSDSLPHSWSAFLSSSWFALRL
jgi:hypothetical protein